MPASAEPTAKVNEIVELTLMPMRRAAPMSSETARMALPSLVFCTTSVSATVAAMVTRTVRTDGNDSVRPATWTVVRSV